MVEFQWFFTALSVLWINIATWILWRRQDFISTKNTTATILSTELTILPSREQLGNFSPAVSKQAVSLVDDKVLLGCPWWLLHTGIKVVMPAFPTLLPQSALQMLGYHCPLFVAVEIYKFYNLKNEGYTSGLQLILTNHNGYTFKSLQCELISHLPSHPPLWSKDP